MGRMDSMGSSSCLVRLTVFGTVRHRVLDTNPTDASDYGGGDVMVLLHNAHPFAERVVTVGERVLPRCSWYKCRT